MKGLFWCFLGGLVLISLGLEGVESSAVQVRVRRAPGKGEPICDHCQYTDRKTVCGKTKNNEIRTFPSQCSFDCKKSQHSDLQPIEESECKQHVEHLKQEAMKPVGRRMKHPCGCPDGEEKDYICANKTFNFPNKCDFNCHVGKHPELHYEITSNKTCKVVPYYVSKQ